MRARVKQEPKPVRKGSSRLRPRARLIRAIGEDLISNEVIAIIELIKNSYDADARRVTIHFDPPLQAGKGAIAVTDDGHGMTLKVLKSAWLEPATISKKGVRRSPKGRRVTGEKGLGRFAAARLAERMHVESVARRPHRRVEADFDWSAFRQDSRFLDQVRCKWMEFRVPPKTPTGTTLRLERLRDNWDSLSLRRLRGELARLVAQSGLGDFAIDLDLPGEFAELGGPITPPPVLGLPHYLLRGEITTNGTMSAIAEVGSIARSLKEQIKVDGDRAPACGPFSFEFRVWDRDSLGHLASTLGSTVRDLRRDLNEACGVSIYRDSFRVLPYGSPENDWLRLDLRRVQNPTLRLSNNQLVGVIHITADANPALRDQTNREGIVETSEFQDFRHCVTEALTRLENIRYEKRRELLPIENRVRLFEDLDIEPIRAAFQQKYPADREFLRYLEDRSRKSRASIEQVQQVIARYRRLATLGQLVDVILHDGRTPVATISNEALLASRDIADTTDDVLQRALARRLNTIDQQTKVLSGLFKRIEPFGGRKRGRPETLPLERMIEDAFAIYERTIKEMGVAVTLPNTQTLVRLDPGEIQSVLINLLDNSLYWLQKVSKPSRQIAVQTKRTDGAVEIVFSDSGPGVADEVRELIFDPYFTTKPEGVGLGLTIAGEIATEHDGSLELIEPGLLSGANFRLRLRRRVAEDAN